MEKSKKKILLVDDEPSVLDLLRSYLSIGQRYEIFLANNVQKATEILANEKIPLVVSDINMPGISGLDLLAIIRSRYPRTRVILMTGYSSPEIRTEVKQNGCHFLEKPINLHYLKRLIAKELSKKDQDGFGGTLTHIQLSDLIQMCCLSAISTAIRVFKDRQEGTIFIENGEIIHAVCDLQEGEHAFYEILEWRSGSFETLGNVTVPNMTIQKHWEALLMEGLRRADEQNAKDLTPAGAEKNSLKILIVDDSSIMCRILTDMLSWDEGIEVIGTAKNGEEAITKVAELKPDLVTMDVNMPVMDGSTALKHIMIRNPCPVVILGALETKANILDFLRFGAVDFIKKPVKSKNMEEQRRALVQRIRMAAKAKISHFKMLKAPKPLPAKEIKGPPKDLKLKVPRSLIIISSGTGGYSGLIQMLPKFPENLNACLVVLQDMPQIFISPLSDYFNKRSLMTVMPLEDDSPVVQGRCYIGLNTLEIPLTFTKTSASSSVPNSPFISKLSYVSKLNLGTKEVPETNPGVENDGMNGEAEETGFDVFLHSIARAFTGRAIVVLLSGADVGNLEGLKHVHRNNGIIMAQKRSACMVPEPLERAVQAQLVALEGDGSEMIRQILDQMGR